MNPNEQTTRKTIIDPLLQKAHWNIFDRQQVRTEIPTTNYDKSIINGFTDYTLYRENGEVLAVVEAKRTSRDPRVGLKQASDYADEIQANQSFRPYIFLTNGDDIFFWDSESAAERHVAGFFSRENLERLLFLKQNKIPLNEIKINDTIINRAYQVEAVRRIAETFEQKKKRKALMVMATGTGKTRTTMALIDVFIRAKQAQKVLFLADRDTLVDQALRKGFRIYLPNESNTRIRTFDINKNVRLFVSTLQTLDLCFSKFTPADFDLIISDECHRSIYNKFSDVLAYFDAMQIGLTATPANFIDRDTFRFFDCEGPSPTFLYDYDTAVKENYLADFNVYSAQTKFQRHGIKFLELSEEDQNALIEQGFNPEDINFEGTDLERKVTNLDTLRRQWEEFMEVCYKDASGQIPAKSIVFAVTHKHALRLKETFDKMYPEFEGKLAQVIDSKMERAKDMLEEFQKKEDPRIAISVDMLDTGFDFPEVMNLAFWKPVNSQIKFWQMIGRGSRHMSACEKPEWLPNFRKDDFLIVDFWENFEHFDMMPKEEEKKSQQPVLVTIFNTRLNKLKHFLGDQQNTDALRIKYDLRNDILKIPLESYTVKRSFNEVRDAWNDEYWKYITNDKLEFLRLKVSPLLRFARNVNQSEAFFTSKMERLGLNKLEKKDNDKVLESIKEDVSLLPVTMDVVKEHEQLINDILTNVFAKSLTLNEIADARDKLAPVMKYKQERPSLVIELGLDDIIESRKWVVIKEGNQKIYIEEYRRKVEEWIEKIASSHPVLKKLKAGEPVSTEDLLDLETTLITEFTTGGLELTEDNIIKAYGVKPGSLIDFIKHVLNIENLPSYGDIVQKAFDGFILSHNYNADQSRFLRAVQTVFMQRKQIDEADLYDVPFTQFGMNAVEKYFTVEEIKDIIQLTKKLAA